MYAFFSSNFRYMQAQAFYLLHLKSLGTACISCSQSCHCPLSCHIKANCQTIQATWSCAWMVPKRLRCFEYLSVGRKHSQVGSRGGTEDEKNRRGGLKLLPREPGDSRRWLRNATWQSHLHPLLPTRGIVSKRQILS